MAADTLRDQKQKIAFAMMSTDDMGEALNRVMVEVEQAIREEREKALREAAEFARHTSEQQDEKIAKLEGYEQTHLGNLDDRCARRRSTGNLHLRQLRLHRAEVHAPRGRYGRGHRHARA